MRCMLRWGSSVLLLVWLWPAYAFAQTGQSFGEITGKAVDEQGAVVPGVTVTISGPALMGEQTAVSEEQRLDSQHRRHHEKRRLWSQQDRQNQAGGEGIQAGFDFAAQRPEIVETGRRRPGAGIQ